MLSSNAVKTAAKLSWCFEGTDETDGFKMVFARSFVGLTGTDPSGGVVVVGFVAAVF